MSRSFALVLSGALVGLLLLTWSLSWAGRVEVVDQQRAGCARGLLDRAENIAADRDSAAFRRDAARARAKDGNLATAVRYEASADRAEARARRREARLIGARLRSLEDVTTGGQPSRVALQEATRACAWANPLPGLLLP